MTSSQQIDAPVFEMMMMMTIVGIVPHAQISHALVLVQSSVDGTAMTPA